MKAWLTSDSNGARWLWKEEPRFEKGCWDVVRSRTLGDSGLPCGYDVGDDAEKTLPWPVVRGAKVEVELMGFVTGSSTR